MFIYKYMNTQSFFMCVSSTQNLRPAKTWSTYFNRKIEIENWIEKSNMKDKNELSKSDEGQ